MCQCGGIDGRQVCSQVVSDAAHAFLFELAEISMQTDVQSQMIYIYVCVVLIWGPSVLSYEIF